MNEFSDPLSVEKEDSFSALMRGVREGSERAVWELVNQYQGYVRRAVRRVLSRKLRPKFDSLDFVQLAWLSFFRLPRHAERIETPEHLVKYLAAMACNKMSMEARNRLETQKHDIQREVPLGTGSKEAVAREPGPVEVAIARERWEQLLQDQPAHYRKIIQLKLQGNTFAEIGRKLELDPQTARRFLKRLLQEIPA